MFKSTGVSEGEYIRSYDQYMTTRHRRRLVAAGKLIGSILIDKTSPVLMTPLLGTLLVFGIWPQARVPDWVAHVAFLPTLPFIKLASKLGNISDELTKGMENV